MTRRFVTLTVALLGCLLLVGVARAALSSIGPTNDHAAAQGLAVPAGVLATPSDNAAAVATNIAEHQAFEATLEARERATAAVAPTADSRNRPTIPASCPRPTPAQSLILPPHRQDPGARNMTVSTQATVVIGLDEYAVSSGSLADNRQQGVIVVTHFASDPCSPNGTGTTVTQYTMPASHGAITLTAIRGEVLEFSTSDGTTGQFDLVTKQFS